jgi:hypothetical protein
MMRPAMPSSPLVVLALAGGVAACGATSASAASIATARRCYLQGAQVHARARGFAPRTPLSVALDGRVLRYQDGSLPLTDAAGGYANAFYAPSLGGRGRPQRRVALVATDGARRARTSFTITRATGATFSPAQGDPLLLRVRFMLWGFALRSHRNALAFLHWLRPDGRVRATRVLCMTRGACGALTSRQARPIFPFWAETGRWTLVIDTHRRYRRHARGPRVRISVNVRPLSL